MTEVSRGVMLEVAKKKKLSRKQSVAEFAWKEKAALYISCGVL
jgi:hypothetical protein